MPEVVPSAEKSEPALTENDEDAAKDSPAATSGDKTDENGIDETGASASNGDKNNGSDGNSVNGSAANGKADNGSTSESSDGSSTVNGETTADNSQTGASNEGAAKKPTLAELQKVSFDTAQINALAPAGLVPSAEVLPEDFEKTESLDDFIAPRLQLWGAPLSANKGYLTSENPLKAWFALDAAALKAGHVGGATENDRMVFLVNLPYCYAANDEGALATTTSEEEWRLRTALQQATEVAADDATKEEIMAAAAQLAPQISPETATRAVLRMADVPLGYSLWQRHGQSWLRLTKDDLAKGVSGTVAFRFEGVSKGDSIQDEKLRTTTDEETQQQLAQLVPGAMDAQTLLPSFELYATGTLPEGNVVAVTWGYEAHSYTNGEGETLLGLLGGRWWSPSR